jgi:hypothetical protein
VYKQVGSHGSAINNKQGQRALNCAEVLARSEILTGKVIDYMAVSDSYGVWKRAEMQSRLHVEVHVIFWDTDWNAHGSFMYLFR